MTQTMNGNNEAGNSQKNRRPGQRQQERLQRLERRRRRQRIWTSAIVAAAVIILATAGFVELQRYNADQAAIKLGHANATATTTAKLGKTATAFANATASVVAKIEATATAVATKACLAKLHIPPTLKAGLKKPPVVTGTPVTLADGLQYIDTQVGCGTAAQATSNISVQYTGWLQSNDKEFDSSYDHGGSPLAFQLGQGQTIKGFDEGIVGMKEGGTRRLIIPAALAYGAQGSPPTIPANAILIFDIVMVKVG